MQPFTVAVKKKQVMIEIEYYTSVFPDGAVKSRSDKRSDESLQ